MKKLLIIASIFVSILTINKNNNLDNVIIPQDSIRLRVVASSNDELDIQKKIELKTYLEKELLELTKNANNTSEVDKIIVDNLEVLNIKISNFLNNNNFKLDYGLNYFPAKTYKGVIYESGMYKSLVVTIGNGQGKNWWCTLFPPLCLLEDNQTTADVEYKFFVSSIIDKLK